MNAKRVMALVEGKIELISKIFWILAAVFFLAFFFYQIDGSLLGHHQWRRTHNALVVQDIASRWDFVAYRVMTLGPPGWIIWDFPLYQILAAIVHVVSGLSIEVSGRLVNLAVFGGILLVGCRLLRDLGIGEPAIRFTSGLFLLNPFYLFWTRSFMIEPIALLLALAWLLCVTRALKNTGSREWYLLAAVTVGILAAMVKATTLGVAMLTFGIFSVMHLSVEWRENQWSVWRMLQTHLPVSIPVASGAILLPITAAVYWTKVADTLKSTNALAAGYTSGNISRFNFGTLEQRFSFATWKHYLDHIDLTLLGHPVVLIVPLLALVLLRGWHLAHAAALALSFILILFVFTNLYYVHDYYFYANGWLLFGALAVAINETLRKANRGGALAISIVLFVSICFVWGYSREYFRLQRWQPVEPLQVTDFIKENVPDGKTVVVYGLSSNPVISYYAERPTIMAGQNRSVEEWPALHSVVTGMPAGEIGAALFIGAYADNDDLIETTVRFLELEPQPTLDVTLYRTGRYKVFLQPEPVAE